jgi:large subunit ribosomal protein L29
MAAKEYREMSDEELAQKRRTLKEQAFHLKLRKTTGQLENPMKLRQTKRDLACLETVLSERRNRSTGEKVT